jgi:hypothetical protein
MANAAEDDAGFDNRHAVRIAAVNAGSVVDETIHVFDAPALNALDEVSRRCSSRERASARDGGKLQGHSGSRHDVLKRVREDGRVS